GASDKCMRFVDPVGSSPAGIKRQQSDDLTAQRLGFRVPPGGVKQHGLRLGNVRSGPDSTDFIAVIPAEGFAKGGLGCSHVTDCGIAKRQLSIGSNEPAIARVGTLRNGLGRLLKISEGSKEISAAFLGQGEIEIDPEGWRYGLQV